MTPQRIQLSRKKGFNLQAVSMALNGLPAVNCARPSKWGNPFPIGEEFTDRFGRIRKRTRDEAIIAFERYVKHSDERESAIRKELRGKNLACFCRPGHPCHCDVLLEIANEP